jgi:putative ubiquitin-RnfH superfamily antitoxin RatB of RatAB toxin-antitoxin module
MENNMITVEIVYALPHQQIIVEEQVALGSTVGEVLVASKIHGQVPDLQIADGKVGIFGKAVKLSQTLKSGDRIEIYRPLINDPKEARRRKAAENAV